MKTVGKQLQEAREAKGWTPELAARETKIKVDRLRDLEADDYSNFSSPTYARGFVRTYARSLGMDEYKMLRQLDNKLPDDDSANIVAEGGGVAYLPETSLPPRAAHRDYTGLYIVTALGGVVALIIAVVLFQAYRVGELSSWLGNGPDTSSTASTTTGSTNATSTATPPAKDTTARALPVDSNTPPPIAEVAPPTTNAPPENAPVAVPSDAPPTISPRAMPVDPLAVDTGGDMGTKSDAPPKAVRALPVDISELNTAPVNPPPTPKTPPPAQKAPLRALPVNLNDMPNGASNTPVAPVTPVTVASNNTPLRAQPVNVPVADPASAPVAPVPSPEVSADSDKALVLTASHDSFVRVTNLDSGSSSSPVYAAVLHSGESVGFSGHKFSINANVPAAVVIRLDGINYGPLSERQKPETIVVQSHVQ